MVNDEREVGDAVTCCSICPRSIVADDGSCLCDCHKYRHAARVAQLAPESYAAACSCGWQQDQTTTDMNLAASIAFYHSVQRGYPITESEACSR